jgi:hypothetical protein
MPRARHTDRPARLAAAAVVALAACMGAAGAGQGADASGDGPLNPDLLAMPPNTWRNLEPAGQDSVEARMYSGACFGGGRLWYFGGAHRSWPGNDVDLFDPRANRWRQVTEPEMPERGSDLWKRLTGGGGGAGGLTPRGRPFIEHTYQQVCWQPDRDRFFVAMARSGTWEFDPRRAEWISLLGPDRDQPRGSWAHNNVLWDPAVGAPVLVVGSGGGSIHRFDHAARVWVRLAGVPPVLNWNEFYSTYVPPWRAHLVSTAKKGFFRFDPAAGKAEPVDSPEALAGCQALSYDAAGRAVVALQRRRVSKYRWTVVPWAMDAESLAWRRLDPPKPWPEGHSTGRWASLWYDPDHGVHLLVSDVQRDRDRLFDGGVTETWAYRYAPPDGKAKKKAAPAEAVTAEPTAASTGLPKVRVSSDGRGFETADGRPFAPVGVNYFRPGTGWAPQVWKQFDAEATARDFKIMQGLGVNCVRVFLTLGSFYPEPGRLAPEALETFDTFLALAEARGIYVHPTGPDHWEGLPDWSRGDRVARESYLEALEQFWRLLAARYRGRNALFAYDLLNEPHVPWTSEAVRAKWADWLKGRYTSAEAAAKAWGLAAVPGGGGRLDDVPVPDPKQPASERQLLEYQHFRESLADAWTRRQAEAIRSADPDALVTVGLIQWSVPVLLPRVDVYSGFRPSRQARFVDFLSVHFYPLADGAYGYEGEGAERRNLAYLEAVVREVARPGKPVVLGEFGWYGGGRPTSMGASRPPASEAQQARWCERVVTTTAPMACGWLNWGLYDHPEARDVTELTGLLTRDGAPKAWGRRFTGLAETYRGHRPPPGGLGERPTLDWDRCLTDLDAARAFREAYLAAFRAGKAGD